METIKNNGRFIDLSNRKIGHLFVLSKENIKKRRTKNGKEYIYWLCLCDCGRQCYISGACLRRKNNNQQCCSNGCIYNTNKKEYGTSALHSLYRKYQRGAKKRNLDFSLSKEEFVILTKQNCYYCGIEPLQKIMVDGGYGEYIYNGIDRVNNELGYIINNCVSCCTQCNKMKLILSTHQFFEHITKIVNKHNLCQKK